MPTVCVINWFPSSGSRHVSGPIWSPKPKDLGFDNVLSDESCCTAQWPVVDGYGAMVEWWSTGKSEKWRKITFSCHFVRSTSEINSVGLNQGFRSDNLAPNSLSYNMAKLSKYNFTVCANLQRDEIVWRKFVILQLLTLNFLSMLVTWTDILQSCCGCSLKISSRTEKRERERDKDRLPFLEGTLYGRWWRQKDY